jgi:hypothetical protein
MMPMIKKHILVWMVAAGMLLTGSAIIFSKKNQQAGSDLLPVDLRALKMADGWGYEVLVDKKVFIHQDCIPAISAFKKFNSESEALLIGNKVVDKIKHGHKPAITQEEINDAQIHY